jgi:hypothetical protein
MKRSITSQNMLRRLLQVQHDYTNDGRRSNNEDFDSGVVLQDLKFDDDLKESVTSESTEWMPDFSIPGREEPSALASSRKQDTSDFRTLDRDATDESTPTSTAWSSYDQDEALKDDALDPVFVDMGPANTMNYLDIFEVS